MLPLGSAIQDPRSARGWGLRGLRGLRGLTEPTRARHPRPATLGHPLCGGDTPVPWGHPCAMGTPLCPPPVPPPLPAQQKLSPCPGPAVEMGLRGKGTRLGVKVTELSPNRSRSARAALARLKCSFLLVKVCCHR